MIRVAHLCADSGVPVSTALAEVTRWVRVPGTPEVNAPLIEEQRDTRRVDPGDSRVVLNPNVDGPPRHRRRSGGPSGPALPGRMKKAR